MTLPTDPNGQTSGDPGQQPATPEPSGQPDLAALLRLKGDVDAGRYIPMERYQGLQGTLAKEQNAKTTALQEVAGLRSQLEALNATKVSLDTQIAELSEFKTTAEPELKVKEEKLNRLNLLVTEFPHLAEFEKDGLLPSGGTAEELKTKFIAFSEKIGALQKQAQQNFRTGSVPSNTGDPGAGNGNANQPPDKSAVIKAMQQEAWELARNGKIKEYDAKMAEIQKLKEQSQATP